MPHGCKVYILDDDAIAIGRAVYRVNLEAYKRCVDADEWPSYDSTPQTLSLPAWAAKQEIEQ